MSTRTIRTIGVGAAILININVMIGSGIFINAGPLFQFGGVLSWQAYLCAGLLLFPVVYTLARLAQLHPEEAGLYVYARRYISPFVGFLCGWSYFIGKTVSVGLVVHLLMQMLQRAIPAFATMPTVLLDAALLGLYVLANVSGVRIQGRVQWLFIAAKTIPLVGVISLLWYGAQLTQALPPHVLTVTQLSDLLPIAVFAMVGFEVTCTMAHLFRDPKRSVVRVLLGGFALIVAVLMLFQGSLGLLMSHVVPGEIALITVLRESLAQYPIVQVFGYACMYTSMIGGSYSILSSNCWNLHALALNGHLPGSQLLARVQQSTQVPWVALCAEACLALVAIAITTAQIPLQRMSVFGVVFAFACAMVASFRARDAEGRPLLSLPVRLAAVAATAYLGALTLLKIYEAGVSIPYLVLLSAGVVASAMRRS